MFELPEHMALPVTADGDGPAFGGDVARWQCWCRAGASCTVVPPTEYEPELDAHAACPDAGCTPDCPARLDARASGNCGCTFAGSLADQVFRCMRCACAPEECADGECGCMS